MERERKRWPWVLGGFFALLIAYCLYAYWPYENRITISPETTFLTGPVNPDGTVNYVAALDRRLREGVTDENNAAPLLIRAAGPKILREETLPLSLRKLHMKPPPADGAYLIRWGTFVREHATREGMNEEQQTQAEQQQAPGLKAPWSEADRPVLAAWVRANREPLERVTQAATRPRFYIPVPCPTRPASMWERPMPSLNLFFEAAAALTARAMRKLGTGDTEGARGDLLTCHRLARLIAQDPTLVGQLVAYAIEGAACGGDFALAESGKLSRQQVMAYLAELHALEPLPPILGVFEEYERYQALDVVMVLYRGESIDTMAGPPGPRTARIDIHWDTMLRIVNDWQNRRVEAYGASRDRREEALHKYSVEVNGLCDRFDDSWKRRIAFLSYGGRPFRDAYTRNMTDLVLTLAVSTPGRAVWLYDEALVKLDLARAAMALAAWKADHGAYPIKLDELAPGYLPEIPQDIFSLEPLIYRRTGKGYLLYSVGCNMLDDGGRGKDDAEYEEEDPPDDLPVEATGGGVQFGQEAAFLRKHTTVLEQPDWGGARVLVAPALQGRVMAATGGGAKGQSFGIVNRKLVEAGDARRRFNGYGGGDRIWLGPEAGPFGLFCPAGDTINRAHWQAPAAVNEGAFEVVSRAEDGVALRKSMEVTNAAGTTFTLTCDRKIRVFDRHDIRDAFDLPPLRRVRMVAYASENRITNTGKKAWRAETGLLSIWIVGVFRASPGAVAVLPFRKGPEEELGRRITDDYFGKVPPDRLAVLDGAAVYRIDGGQVGKVGIPSGRSKGVFGSYDPGRGALTLVKFSMPPAPAGYVNYEWLAKPAKPYEGDAIMVYCSGPKVAGAGPRGGAYELETASPAAALAPGESLSHTHTTVHLTGSRADLDTVARAALGVGLDQVDAAWGKQRIANSD